MKQLTVRGFDDDLERSIRQLARREGISLNQAALKLLRRGAGLPDGQGDGRNIGDATRRPVRLVELRMKQTRSMPRSEVFESVDESDVAVRAMLDCWRLLRSFMRGSQRVSRPRPGTPRRYSCRPSWSASCCTPSDRVSALEQRLAQLRSFLDRPYVSFVPAGPVTADRYSRIMDVAQGEGTTNPDQRRLDRGTRDGDRRRPRFS